MGVIYDHDERFADIVQVIGFLDQAFFTGKRGSLVVYFKSMAQDFDGVKIRMQGPCNGNHQGGFVCLLDNGGLSGLHL